MPLEIHVGAIGAALTGSGVSGVLTIAAVELLPAENQKMSTILKARTVVLEPLTWGIVDVHPQSPHDFRAVMRLTPLEADGKVAFYD